MKAESEQAPLVGVGGAIELIPKARKGAVKALYVSKTAEVFLFLGRE